MTDTPLDHDPCCSSHGVPMTCERYRRTHFVEVRPCCSVDAVRLRAEKAEAQVAAVLALCDEAERIETTHRGALCGECAVCFAHRVRAAVDGAS